MSDDRIIDEPSYEPCLLLFHLIIDGFRCVEIYERSWFFSFQGLKISYILSTIFLHLFSFLKLTFIVT